MNSKTRFYRTGAVLLMACAIALGQGSGPTAKTPAARKAAAVQKLLDRAETARKTGDLLKSIKLYKKAIVAAADKEDAQHGLSIAIYLSEYNRLKAESKAAESRGGKAPDEFELNEKVQAAAHAKLAEFYRPLLAANPGVTAYRFQLVRAEHADDGQLKPELEKIVAENPNYAPALVALGDCYGPIGEPEKEREYYRRACAAAPDNPLYAFGYLETFRTGDVKEYFRRVEEFVTKYPDSLLVPMALLEASSVAETTEERQTWLERATNRPKTYWASELIALYARTDIHKAADYAQQKLDEARKDPNAAEELDSVTKTADLYHGLARAQDLLKGGQLAEAQAALEKLKPLWIGFPMYPKPGLMAEILIAQNKAPEAYKSLLEDRETLADADLTAMAVKIGTGLGKSETQVEEDIISAVRAKARPPDDFELENLTGTAKVKLSSLRGKYVLVNFWHPT